MGWVIFLVIAVPLLAVVGWIVMSDSFVQIEAGQLGLLLVKGKATDKVLEPGPHWVPALRRRMVQAYPSTELSFRTGLNAPPTTDLERWGVAPRVVLGDRVSGAVAFTVRFRLDPTRLREAHNRFGPEGILGAAGDVTSRTMRDALAHDEVGVDHLFGSARVVLEERLGGEIRSALDELGFSMTLFTLGDVDLGRTGDVIQATARARHELEREQAEAPMRSARAQIDADLAPLLAAPAIDAALRYREVDSWPDLLRASGNLSYTTGRLGSDAATAVERGAEPAEATPADAGEEAGE